MIQNAFFIISDITGYTAYLTKSELDHAHEILQTLFDEQLAHMRPPIVVSNFQGDAIFTYVPENSFLQGQTLLEMIEGLYFAFARKLELMRMNTTCTCNACRNMSGLDLKIFAHYGQCLTQKVGGKEELLGPDVILVHRMMKNRVAEKTGLKAYALFSQAAAELLDLRECCEGLREHSEEYEHIGEVPMLVHCLHEVWLKEKEKRRTAVTKEEAWISFEEEIPAPPALVWDYLTKVEVEQQWLGVDVEERIDGMGGRQREGSEYHCAHGDMHLYYKIVDWQPFDHVTRRSTIGDDLAYLQTFRLRPIGENVTHLGVYVGKPEKDVPGEKKKMLEAAIPGYFGRLRDFVAADLAAGKVIHAPPSQVPAQS